MKHAVCVNKYVSVYTITEIEVCAYKQVLDVQNDLKVISPKTYDSYCLCPHTVLKTT